MTEELAKDIKIHEDLNQLSAFLTKLNVEAADPIISEGA